MSEGAWDLGKEMVENDENHDSAFQSDPVLGMFLSYYTSSGIIESPPHKDPRVNLQPLGVLALTAAAVCNIQPSREPPLIC